MEHADTTPASVPQAETEQEKEQEQQQQVEHVYTIPNDTVTTLSDVILLHDEQIAVVGGYATEPGADPFAKLVEPSFGDDPTVLDLAKRASLSFARKKARCTACGKLICNETEFLGLNIFKKEDSGTYYWVGCWCFACTAKHEGKECPDKCVY